VMVARGDLGVEMPADQVPVIQKQLISACRDRGVPVIVATQMLDSMIRNPRPTRAEVSDVANAVVDHADAVMLSGETATGLFPVETVEMMSQTVRTMEQSDFDSVTALRVVPPQDIHQAIGASVRLLVDSLCKPPVIIATATGRTAQTVSSMRPEVPIYAYAFDPHVARSLRLIWGVDPRIASHKKTSEQQLAFALKDLRAKRLIKKGEMIIAVSGSQTFPKSFANRVEVVTG